MRVPLTASLAASAFGGRLHQTDVLRTLESANSVSQDQQLTAALPEVFFEQCAKAASAFDFD